jgi:hypothetical protein
MFRLPVSGLRVALRQPAGSEDLLIREITGPEIGLALALIERIAWAVDGTTVDWSALSVTDIEALLLRIRQTVFGDGIRAETNCSNKECGARFDISFSAERYLAHQSPRIPKGVEPGEPAGWFRLTGEIVEFRLPNGVDLVAVGGSRHPDRECFARCVKPTSISGRLRNRIESAMAALAPSLSHDVQGQCPQCQRTMSVYFDVRAYVLRELREQAAAIYNDVHLLAFHYKWPEESILALPRSRRVRYAQMLMQEEAMA